MEKALKSNKPIIGIFLYSLTGGGAERFISYLVPHLLAKNYEVKVVLMNTHVSFELPAGVGLHYLEKSDAKESGLLKFAKIPYLAYKYARFRKRYKITHSFSLLTRPNYINILSKTFFGSRGKTVISERAYPTLQYGYGDLKSKLNKTMISILFKKADAVICNAKGNAEDLVKNFKVPKQKITVIHNPIDMAKIDAIAPKEDFFDSSFFNLISVGRVDEGKNHRMLVEAIAPIENVRLYLLGDGELRHELQHYLDEFKLNEKVFLLGFDPNPYQYLKQADLFIFGSNHEGFPNVLLEAMACGLPLLSTNCKSGPSEIMELEKPKKNDIMITAYGVLVPTNSAELMRKGVNYFLEHSDFYDRSKENIENRIKDFELTRILDQYTDKILA